jgi:Mn2+/Fe2+ NRAMP family transporter
MTLLLLSSTLIAASCIGMAYCILSEGRLESRDREREILIIRLARASLQDELDLPRHSPAGH